MPGQVGDHVLDDLLASVGRPASAELRAVAAALLVEDIADIVLTDDDIEVLERCAPEDLGAAIANWIGH